MKADARIMLVDDEPNLLNGLARQLRGAFAVETFHQPKVALGQVTTPSPCAVVVSDMRMPEMNGIEFLSAVQQASPDTVRIMLTGNADRDTVTQAVNQSNIFRFLMKPCSPDDLSKAISDGIAQYKLVTAERDLLQRTLAGSVKLLTDILALARPEDFKDVLEKRELVRLLCKELKVPGVWEVELALMLAPIGAITLPPEVLEARSAPEQLTTLQREALNGIPGTSKKLVSNIPRLERVATFIEQACGVSTRKMMATSSRPDLALQVLHTIAGLSAVSLPRVQIQKEIQEFRTAGIDAGLLQILETQLLARQQAVSSTSTTEVYEVDCAELCAGQLLLSDVMTNNGKLLITAGNVLTDTLVERIRGYATLVGVKEPIQVNARIPTVESV